MINEQQQLVAPYKSFVKNNPITVKRAIDSILSNENIQNIS